jgi:hypothetical protein
MSAEDLLIENPLGRAALFAARDGAFAMTRLGFSLTPPRAASLRICLALAAPAWLASAAEARPARCSTSDDGGFACAFVQTDKNGSFKISAPGKPTTILIIDEPGIAFGFVNFGTRNIALPGRYLRSKTDPACWINDSTQTEICAH